ncbi:MULTISPECIES: cyanoexosortase B system-associated protein [Cyanophyceae]|uniref:cyanoexosortase B system-associated protein n=1 Tax=Cyanophyceae TaxID=3028117 RepID=UPI00168483E6|nr:MULTISPECIES: cyanoexosortase B system-associated protein [Cyanophyceae]MBD1917952.1 cyanoexosortase B system-associated protein [Phormidium sp. FACHB-77]MBD2029200.1 cyanoexosortase B system-associated protein [Phormidium sp. FACHB-322]MBD2049732.1 cyanoexosortase B system-associated protein [Leptolyngbya sp. FACHB-60]
MTPQPSSANLLPSRWVNLVLVVVLTALAGMATLPAYLSGQWPWANSPQVSQLDQLRALQTEGLALPGWQQTTVEPVPINRQTWTLAEYRADSSETQSAPVQQFAVLLHPQPWHSNQPQLEWIDLAGAQKWRIESRRRLKVTSPQAGSVEARFFRAWGDRQSFAIVQWYAMPSGGHPSPSHWFWANQWSQLTQRRLTPWVAVSLLLPMEPLGTMDAYQSLAENLTGLIQQQLTAAVFNT